MKGKDELSLVCPYCGQILEQGPPRKRKCPFCKGFLYVRRLPSTGKRVLVTKERAKRIELWWDEIHFRERWLGVLDYYGITKDEYYRLKVQLSHKSKTGASDRDVIWSFLNRLVQEKMVTANFGDLSMLYHSMALLLEEDGKDFFDMLQEARRMKLIKYREEEIIAQVQISTAGYQSCPSCQRLEGKVFKIDDALREMPIPNKECTTPSLNPRQGFCRCCYAAYHPDWEISIRGVELPGGDIGIIRER